MEKQALFKTSVVGGFNKSEVLTYIDELSSSSKEMEKQLGEKITELEAANQKLGEDIASVNLKLETAQEKLERFCYIGDDRNIKARYIDGKLLSQEF